MKDKLVKFNRKAPYYRFKKALIVFSALAVVAVAVSVPLSLKIVADQAQASENTSTEVVE